MIVDILSHTRTPNEGDSTYDGYYCINTDEFNCDCRREPWVFIHYKLRVIVWPEKDDDRLLYAAKEFKTLGINPRIVEYKAMMGKCIEWDDIPNGETLG